MLGLRNYTIIIIIIISLLSFYCGIVLHKFYKKYQQNKRFKKAKKAETEAEILLVKSGFKVLDSQVAEKFSIIIDGTVHLVEAKPDIIAEKKGKKYIVEVKTGEKAIKPTNPSTRRQLLEYSLVFKDFEVLLFDMTNQNLYELDFPIVQKISKTNNFIKELLLLISGIFFGLIIGKLLN